ncbi:MAG: hypothetical protein JW850_01120 [Thermoflexales bacterium]|nr:hypothetical protein [Thermoflexales bacterium]
MSSQSRLARVGESLLGAAQVAGALILSPLLRSWYNRWGVSGEETRRSLPGDELAPSPHMSYTRALVVHAPAERVWQWLVQIGQGRGGMYSFDGLENLAGCDIHTVNRIVPELQDLRVGELIRLGPKGYPCFCVVAVEPKRSLVLVGADPKTEQAVAYVEEKPKGYSLATWQFFLEPSGDGATRLFTRQRLAYSPELAAVWRVTEPISFVMERKMLLGIKRRAEKEA